MKYKILNVKYKIFFLIFFYLLCFAKNSSADLIDPNTDLQYLGAFRLPNDIAGSQYGWNGSLSGMAFYPKGDPNGSGDGLPGSIFGINHTYEQYVAEISIPIPVNSKNLDSLNRAEMLQSFHDINNGTYSTSYLESEIAYLPKQGNQTEDKLYISWNDWYNVGDQDVDRYGWSELDLSNPNTQGPWGLGSSNDEVNPHNVGEFMFEIPASWAAAHTPGKLLVTGKYRPGGSNDGGCRFGGGPGMHAFGPWNQGNPPSSGTILDQTTLLSYVGCHVWNCTASGDIAKVTDQWEGGAWISAGNKNAIVLTGTKGLGENYYDHGEESLPNGCTQYNHGYHNLGGHKPYMLFYNPDDLAAVADGTMQPYEPQPYAVLDGGVYAFNQFSLCGAAAFAGAAYDREHQLLYVAEAGIDGNYDPKKPIIHVFKINVSVDEIAPISPSGLAVS